MFADWYLCKQSTKMHRYSGKHVYKMYNTIVHFDVEAMFKFVDSQQIWFLASHAWFQTSMFYDNGNAEVLAYRKSVGELLCRSKQIQKGISFNMFKFEQIKKLAISLKKNNSNTYLWLMSLLHSINHTH